MAPIVAMSDTATMHILAQEGQPQMYGRLRLGGSFGWAIAAPLVGALVALRGIPWAFWTYAAVMLVALLVSLQLRYPGPAPARLRLDRHAPDLVRNARGSSSC